MYRSAKTTRDRERLRREVLESLGWKVHRIWARDWIRNYQEELEKVIKLIN
jgi:very-short-patch-repair endonuclease